MDLSGKIALVTGGARGIGQRIVLALAESGCHVIVSDIDFEGAKQTADVVQQKGVKSLALQADVSSADDVSAMIDKSIEMFGRIDILVNNAGITRDNLLIRMKEEDWDLVLRINLKGAFLCTKQVIRPMMKQRSGKVINIASVVGVMGNAGQANYSASKAGMIGLTKSAAKEVAGKNIQINAIAPGFIQTEMTDHLREDVKETYMASIPAKVFGTPQDVANAVLFLASPMADYITGQVVHVDGGLVM
ncbi:3-oxoacyl-[acyl-carrier-protein] reductase [candidate division KSB1 bacterium]|nr:3-oxoacyl-[acyl-carrier-protein] reductase [candidate division KSB1 bacterium]